MKPPKKPRRPLHETVLSVSVSVTPPSTVSSVTYAGVPMKRIRGTPKSSEGTWTAVVWTKAPKKKKRGA